MSVVTATIEANSVTEAVAKVDEIHKAFGNDVEIDLAILADNKDAEVLGYAFPWLKGTQEEIKMAGAIEFNIITDMTKLPQKVASAASAMETAEITGASYKPIMYAGTQPVRGTNYWFIAEQTLITNPPKKALVTIAVNEFQGKFEIVPKTIHEIKFENAE
ncbi:MAG: hypothetical protein IJP68_00380 [Selenomonadaceae bacterium]|nr:hypothetical protein [Selenomonadaceae bacterium]